MTIIYEAPPSRERELLASFIGARIARLVRYTAMHPGDVPRECVPTQTTFSLTSGPFAVVFEDGRVLGVASRDSQVSVTVWLDRPVTERPKWGPPLDENPGFVPIEADDPIYSTPFWVQFSGRRLVGLTLLKKKIPEVFEEATDSGLIFYVDGGAAFLAVHELHDGVQSFAVIERSQIPPEIAATVEEVPLFPS